MHFHGYSTASEPDDFGMRRVVFPCSGKFLRVISLKRHLYHCYKTCFPTSTQDGKQSGISGDLIEEYEESLSPADLPTT